jgi:hypothetical protein
MQFVTIPNDYYGKSAPSQTAIVPIFVARSDAEGSRIPDDLPGTAVSG